MLRGGTVGTPCRHALPTGVWAGQRFLAAAFLAAVLAAGSAFAQTAGGEVYVLPTVEVVAATPVSGVGLSKDKVPANVQFLGRRSFTGTRPPGLGGSLSRRFSSVAVNEVQSNPLQPDVQYRGFTASPLLGNPQGLAVYQNGVRVNEPFGEIVQWDLIPDFAVDSAQIIPGSNPVYGLNALGGAIAIDMKNGFVYDGAEVRSSGGSFGRREATGEVGARTGPWGFYAGATGFDESGWRDESPSDLQQFFADVRRRGEDSEFAVTLTLARTELTGNGPAPVELLAQDRNSVFTFPDVTENRLAFVEFEGNQIVSETLSVQGNVYFRHAKRETLNGDEQAFAACTGVAGPATTLCTDPGPGEAQVLDLSGSAVPVTAGGDGAFNSTRTSSNGFGASVQATEDGEFFGLENVFVAGVSADLGSTRFRSESEIGALTPERTVSGSGIFAGGDEFNTRLEVDNRFLGIYALDTLSLDEDLHVTFSGRFNRADIELEDRFGTALNGDHSFDRFNPALGVTYRAARETTVYAGYSEANRAPSAVELGCADPGQPCRVPNAFVSDPPLRQVVTRSVELGARGSVARAGEATPVNWSLAGFASRNFDDIVFVSAGSPVGSGFFQNAGITQRVGAELGLDGRVGILDWYASYSFVRATFQSRLALASPNHPQADSNGEIRIGPGDRIPGIPQSSARLGARLALTELWTVALESVVSSGTFLRGDEANLLDPLGGYAVVNLHSAYRVADFLDAFVQVDNLFDTDYATFGQLGDPGNVLPGFSDPRFVSPGPPLGVWVGVTLLF